MKLARSFANLSAGRWFVRHRNVVLLLFMALLIPATFLASQLPTDNAIERWLGDDDPAVRQWDEFRQRFAIRPQITALVDGMLPNDERIERAATSMEKLAVVEHVWTPGRLRTAVGATGPTRLDGLLTPQNAATMFWIELSDAAARDSRETVRQLRLAATQSDIPPDAVHLGGPLVINAALDRWGRNSLESLLPFVGVVSVVLLWLLRGSLFQGLLLSFSASITVLLTFAIMQLAGAQIDLLLVALPPLIAVLHLSVGIHLLHHFDSWQERLATAESDGSRADAVTLAFQETFAPSCLATATTIIGMLSLTISDLGPVRGFGIWSAVGLLISFVVAYAFLPCFLIDATPVRTVQLACRWISHRFYWTRRLVFGGSLLLLLTTAGGWQRLVPDFNAIRFLPSDSRTITDYDAIEERCCGLVPVELDIDLTALPSGAQRFQLLKGLSDQLESRPEITTALSAAAFSHGHPISETLMKRWVSADRNHFRVSALVRSSTDRELKDVVSDITEDIANLGQTPNVAGPSGETAMEAESVTTSNVPCIVTGLVSLIDESQRAIYQSLRDSLLLAGCLIAVVLIVLLRSIRAGLIALIPNIGPIVIGFGVVGWLGLPLDVGTVLTASIALGIALDDSLHFLHQYRQASRSSSNVSRCVRQTWQACARPMIQTTLVASIGLAILSFSQFRPVAYFGRLMAVLLVFALLADLVLLPFILTTSAGRLFRAANGKAERNPDVSTDTDPALLVKPMIGTNA